MNKNQDQSTSTARLAGLGVAGTWLIVLITISVFVAVVIFSATQFQTRLANLAVSGKALSVWKADQLRQEWAANVLSLNNAAKDLQSARKNLEEHRQYMEQALAARSEIEGQGYDRLADLTARVSPIKAGLAEKLTTASWQDVPAVLAEAVGVINNPEIRSSLDNFVTVRQKWNDADLKVRIGEKQQASLDDIQKKRAIDFDNAKKAVHLDLPDADASLENAVYEFQTMYENYPLSYRVTLAPSDLLVLVLVI